MRGAVVLIALVALWGVGSPAARAQETDNLTILNQKAVDLFHAGNYAEATEVAKRSLARAEGQLGADHPDLGALLHNLAALYRIQGRYAEAQTLYERSLANTKKAMGPEHANVGISLNNLAGLYRDRGHYAEAETLYQQSLAIIENALGPDHPRTGQSLSNLAISYQDQGRYAEAESLLQRSLAIIEKTLEPDHADVGRALNNLAILYQVQGRYPEAELLLKRSFAVGEKTLGSEHPGLGVLLRNLAVLYRLQGDYSKAEFLSWRSLAITEKALGADHLDVATALYDLAQVYLAQGRYDEAEPFFQRSLAVKEIALGPNHPWVGVVLSGLAQLYLSQGRTAEAEPLYQRNLTIQEKALGVEHPDVATSLNNLAVLAFSQRDWPRAAQYWRRSTAVLLRRSERGAADVGQVVTGKKKGEAQQSSFQFRGLVKVTHRLRAQNDNLDTSVAQEMFLTAQWAQGSEAAGSLAQMAARNAKGDTALAVLVRERQDLVEEWQKLDGLRIAAVSQAPDKRDRAVEAAHVVRLAVIDTRIADIDKRLVAEFPDYAALSRPAALSVQEVQAQLGTDEALVVFLDTPEAKPTPEETFIWVVTKTDMRWVKSELGTPALTREVAGLRCGLDYALWDDDSGRARCRGLIKGEPSRNKNKDIRLETLPFDADRAHRLYKALFGGVEDLIRDKHLLIVPSGPLTQLPFHVLVTAVARAKGDYRSTAWLARQHAITVLPAVSSLKALRQLAKASQATKPIIGFGNPLLDGPDDDYTDLRLAAVNAQSCGGLASSQVAKARSLGGLKPIAQRRGLMAVADVRRAPPLPETTQELCDVAKTVGATQGDIFLGAKTTEERIKSLSADGTLLGYRVLHFATHGALADEISTGAEPGLLLTPPEVGSETDDGYLSASEVAGLKLDADWVILSACNTAAGGAKGAEALSGLARAFFYAGARSLLASHWKVDSAATVKLITQAVGTTMQEKTLGRAQALRIAMLAMIDKGEAREAHPAYWAPFIVVGEGGAAK
jgi:CHAT domain-containing protein/tetratricopeptide (TPR) repeat protein